MKGTTDTWTKHCLQSLINLSVNCIVVVMPSQSHREIFTKIKPRLELAISIATFYVTNQKFREYLLIRVPLISAMLCFIFTTTHIVNNFQLNTNIAQSLIFCIGSLQTISKIFSMRYYRSNVLKLLNKSEDLHNNPEDENISEISSANLIKFSHIWMTCVKSVCFYNEEFFFQ